LAWNPLCPEEQALKDFYRCLQNLLEDKTKLSNRMENLDKGKLSFTVWENLLESVEKQIKNVEHQIKTLVEVNETLRTQVDLLKTIPGVSQKTAVAILSELPNVQIE
jgi:transposase